MRIEIGPWQSMGRHDLHGWLASYQNRVPAGVSPGVGRQDQAGEERRVDRDPEGAIREDQGRLCPDGLPGQTWSCAAVADAYSRQQPDGIHVGWFLYRQGLQAGAQGATGQFKCCSPSRQARKGRKRRGMPVVRAVVLCLRGCVVLPRPGAGPPAKQQPAVQATWPGRGPRKRRLASRRSRGSS